MVVLVYFSIMTGISHNNVDFTGLRFVVELFTIPMLLIMPVCLFLSIRYFKRSPLWAAATIIATAATVAIFFYVG